MCNKLGLINGVLVSYLQCSGGILRSRRRLDLVGACLMVAIFGNAPVGDQVVSTLPIG